MIFEGSRYEYDVVVQVTDADGALHPAIYTDPLADANDFEFVLHTVIDGDRMDQLAQDNYGDPELWWIIARANPEVFYPEKLDYGTVLRIPVAPMEI